MILQDISIDKSFQSVKDDSANDETMGMNNVPRTLIRLLVMLGLTVLGSLAMFDEFNAPIDLAGATGIAFRTQIRTLNQAGGGPSGQLF